MKFIHRLGLNLYLGMFFAIFLTENRERSVVEYIFLYLMFLAASTMLMWNSGEKEDKK